MKVSELKQEMDEQFADVKRQFMGVRQQFADVRQQFTRVDEQFARVDDRFTRVDEQLLRLAAENAAAHEATRRHFDVVGEHLRADLRIVIDKVVAVGDDVTRLRVSVANDVTGLDRTVQDHEVRLRSLEGKQ